MTESLSEMNVCSEHYSIAGAVRPCPRCGCGNELRSLAVPPGHALREPELCGAIQCLEWQIVPCSAFLFHLERLAPAVEARLGMRSTGRGASEQINRCIRCNYAWPDEELFCEPGGAFFPTSEQQGQRLAFTPVAEPLWAVAGGHAPDPTFVHPRFAR